MAYTIGQFQSLNEPSCLILTQHCRRRLMERGIRIGDIQAAIHVGQIIEDYPTDYPFPSCLILGESAGRAIHVCASIHDDMIYLITAYVPDPERWDADWKTRREAAR